MDPAACRQIAVVGTDMRVPLNARAPSARKDVLVFQRSTMIAQLLEWTVKCTF